MLQYEHDALQRLFILVSLKTLIEVQVRKLPVKVAPSGPRNFRKPSTWLSQACTSYPQVPRLVSVSMADLYESLLA